MTPDLKLASFQLNKQTSSMPKAEAAAKLKFADALGEKSPKIAQRDDEPKSTPMSAKDRLQAALTASLKQQTATKAGTESDRNAISFGSKPDQPADIANSDVMNEAGDTATEVTPRVATEAFTTVSVKTVAGHDVSPRTDQDVEAGIDTKVDTGKDDLDETRFGVILLQATQPPAPEIPTPPNAAQNPFATRPPRQPGNTTEIPGNPFSQPKQPRPKPTSAIDLAATAPERSNPQPQAGRVKQAKSEPHVAPKAGAFTDRLPADVKVDQLSAEVKTDQGRGQPRADRFEGASDEPRAPIVKADETAPAARPFQKAGDLTPAQANVQIQIVSTDAGSEPAHTVTEAIKSEPTWSAYFRNTGASTNQPIKSLKIQLNPAELGTVTAHIRAAGDALEVEIAAETTEAHKHLAAEADDILRSLRQIGIDVDKVTVHLTSNDANAKNPSGQEWRNFSSFQGQDRREGETSQRGRNGGGTGGETVTGAMNSESRASEAAGRYI